MPRTTRLISAAAVSAALAASTLTATTTSAQGADPEPVFTLQVPTRIHTHAGGRRGTFVPLGITAVTGEHGLDIRSRRESYDDPIITSWTSGDRSGTLPAGTQKDFTKLPRMVRIVVRDADGAVAHSSRVGACFNNGGSRAVPEGPATNPYPVGCPYLPLTVGSVQGMPEHWQVPLSYREGFTAKLGRGRYDVAVSVTNAYAKSFGLTGDDRTYHSVLRVSRKAEDDHHHHRAASRSSRAIEDDQALVPGPRPAAREAGTDDGPRPDLRSLPAFDIELNGSGRHIRFGATVWNAGTSPLLIDGFRRDAEDVMDTYQYFFDAEGNQVDYELIGEMKYHGANHQHWHYQDFARYRLLDADKQPVARSKKVSFCLANTDAVDYTVPGADWHPEGTDLSTACGGPSAQGVRQALSSGSGDTYHQFRAGQALPLKGLPNGIYYISVEANPFGRIIEADDTNNVALRRIRIGGTASKRTIRVQKFSMVEEGASSY